MNFKDMISYLDNYSEYFNIVAKAKENCEEQVYAHIKNILSEWYSFRNEELLFELSRQELVFSHIFRSTPIVQTRIGIYIKDPDGIYFLNMVPIGFYQMDTNEEGEIIDDWLVFETIDEKE